MKHVYSKSKSLLLLLGLFICSLGMAQSPLQVRPNSNAKTAVENPATKQIKKQNPPYANQSANQKVLNTGSSTNAYLQEPVIPNGSKKLSEGESQQISNRLNTEQTLVQPLSNTSYQDTTGVDVKTFAKSANLNAKNIFEAKKSAFSLKKADYMQLKSTSLKHNRTVATYQQMHNSIPVEGAMYKVREDQYKIEAFGYISSDINLNSNYKLSNEDALQQALNKVNAKEYLWESKKLSSLVHKNISKKPKGELVYVGPNFSTQLNKYHLAWKFDVYATSPQVSQTVYVDANTGNIILTIDLQRDTDVIGKGKSRYAGEVTFNTQQFADGYRLQNTQGKYNVPIYTLNMNHADWPTDEIITDFIDEDNIWTDLHNESRDESAIDIHWGMQKTIDYYTEKFDRNSVDDEGLNVIGLAHLGENVSNASWTGGWAQFGDGNNAPYVSLGITAHELTHAVTQFSANLVYAGESGALNESFSDMLGVAVEFYVGKDTKDDIWKLGDELYDHGSMRNMADPNVEGHPDTYGGRNWVNPANLGYDNGGVHINSGVSNYWFYLLCEGGNGVNDNYDDYDVSPIGIEKAEKLAYVTLTEYLTPSSNFAHMRQASLMAAEDLFGLGSEEYIQITNAWYAVGVGTQYSDNQLSLVSFDAPTVDCGPLTGTEPFYITVKNTGAANIMANSTINYKIRVMVLSRGRFFELYSNDGETTFDNEIPIGESGTLKVQDDLPYLVNARITNYVEIKLDFDPIEDFSTKSGLSVLTGFIVPPGEKDLDLALKSISLPTTSGNSLPTDHKLSTTIKNLGCLDIASGTSFKVGYINTLHETDTIWKSVTLTEDFKGESELTVEFDNNIDLSAQGLHTFEAFVSYQEDPVPSNNSIINATFSGSIQEFPYSENFERTTGAWTSVALQNDQNWVYYKNPIKFRGLPSEYMWGTAIYGKTILSTTNADFALESPVLDFTNITSPYMEFDAIWAFEKGYDGLIIEYSEDNGTTWVKIDSENYSEDTHYNDLTQGPWFTGVNSQSFKDPIKVRLNNLAGKKAKLRFRVLTNENPDNFYGAFVDNIYIDEAPYDLEVISANINAGECELDFTSANLTVDVVNNFPTNQETLTFTTQILNMEGEELYAFAETGTINFTKFKDTVSYNFTTALNFSSFGEHQVSVTVYPEDTAKEIKPENNAIVFYEDIWPKEDLVINSLPYLMDFEDENGYTGWRTKENKGSNGWKHGVRSDLGTPGWFIAEHTNFMASNDDKCNCDASNDMLISPVFDLSNYTEAYLSFDGYGDRFQFSDGYVKVSTDGGITWKTIYNIAYLSAWQEYDVDLSDYAGQSCVQIAFVHDDNGLFANGFAVDNIEIKKSAIDFKVANLSVPEMMYTHTPDHKLFIGAKNIGYNAVDQVVINYQILQNGNPIGSPVDVEKNASVLQNESIIYIIEDLPELEEGVYDIEITVNVEGEINLDDNKVVATINVVNDAPSLTTLDFSDFEQGALFGQKGWISNEGTNNYPWKVVVQHENPYLSLPKTDHTGDESAQMLYNQLENNYYYGELNSSFFSLPDNVAGLEFYYALQSNTINALILDIKTLNGEWEEVWRVSNQGDHRDRTWQKAVVNLSAYKNSNIMLRFRHAKASGYSYMALDDITMTTDPLTDVAIELISPRDICGVNDEVTIRLTNSGQVDIAADAITLDLEYSNTQEAITELVDVNIAIGESIDYTFKVQPTLSDVEDSHVFNLVATLEGDEITNNNIINNYVYQKLNEDFKIFDNTTIYGYQGQTLYLDAETNIIYNELNASSYTWSNGETSNGIYVNQSGTYDVTVMFANGCELTESVNVQFDNFESKLASGDVCGPVVDLNPGEYDAYEWFDGSTNATYPATASGDYYVTVYKNGVGKILHTSINIIGNETPEIQVYKSRKLGASLEGTSYQWYLNNRPLPNSNTKSILAIWEGEYTVEVTNSNGCSSISEPFNADGLIVEKLMKPFRVYPNPTEGYLNLFLSNEMTGTTSINVYALGGQMVMSNTYSDLPEGIDLSTLDNGIYIVECIIEGEKYTTKVVKK